MPVGDTAILFEYRCTISGRSEEKEIRIKSDERIDWAEMSFNPTNFILKDFVPEPGFKFTLTTGGCGHVHGLLATTE